jgi:Icc-related predicted phosphoesterase
MTTEASISRSVAGPTADARTVNVLAVCDDVDSRLYGRGAPKLSMRPDLILSCGDLPSYYLDYLVSKLNVPLYAIHGNHDVAPPLEGSHGFERCGASWIGGRGVRAQGLLMAGFDGSLRYNGGAYQSSQVEMHAAVRGLVPWLLMNRVRYGRFLDVLVTHAPPRGIHDQPDRCHTGFDAYNWLIKAFAPRYHLHGHVHLYDRRTPTVTRVGTTEVVNVYPFRELMLTIPVKSCASTNLDSA